MNSSTRTGKVRAAAISLVLGPLLLTVGDTLRRMVEPSGSNLSGADIANAAGHHGAMWLAAGLLEIAAAVFLVVGVAGLSATAGGRGSRVTTVGAVMVGVGAIASVGHAMGYFFYYAALSAAHFATPQIEALDRAGDTYPMLVAVLVLFIVGLEVGTLVLFAGLRRAGRVPVWAVLAALAFVVLAETGGVATGILGIVAALVAFVPAARSLMKPPADARGELRAEAPVNLAA